MSLVRVLPYGDRGLLVEMADVELVPALATALGAEPGVEEAVPAARTVLVLAQRRHHTRLSARVAELLDSLTAGSGAVGAAGGIEPVELQVRYDGADLAATAAELDLGTDDLVRAHTAAEYVVAFCGFAPGFAYLRGLDPVLHVGRLSEPRTTVPAGSVGIAGEFTGVYPRRSPGGWRLLGRTDAELWDPGRDRPALLAPGTRVRFVAT